MDLEISDRRRPIPSAPVVRLLLACGVIATFVPVSAARGGTPGRLHARRVVPPRRAGHGHARPVGGVHIRVKTPARLPVPVAAPAPAPVPVPAPAPVPSVAPPASPPTPSVEEQIFALTNQARQANGIEALSSDDRLNQAAQIQASAMATFGVMDHDLPEAPEPTLQDRLQFVGYTYAWAAENIEEGAPDAPSAVADWMNSPPHRANLLSPQPTAIGVGVAYDSHGTPYYCQVFGESQ